MGSSSFVPQTLQANEPKSNRNGNGTANGEIKRIAVYVHFPWCLAKCPYCDFVSYVAETIPHASYADAVIDEIGARSEHDPSISRLTSVFFGGGTPSLWEPSDLARVLRAILDWFPHRSPDIEVTVECNPTSLDVDRAKALRDSGVTRLSIGTQSLRPEQLKFLGRLHDPSGARASIEAALASGIGRVSTDMIFGLPGQSPEDARAQAIDLADMGLTHLSCYQLTIEPGTQFGELAKRGRLPLADDGLVAESFLQIDEALSSRGFTHYEISNYAQPGQESRHNLSYWHGDDYVGLGCAAYGFSGIDQKENGPRRGVRYRNLVDPNRYMAAARNGGMTSSREELDAVSLVRERLMLGLRLVDGVDLDACERELGVSVWTDARAREVEKLISLGRIVREGGRLRIPRASWLWTDDTAARLF